MYKNKELDDFLERDALNNRLSKIKHKILIFSGKGGVGKSTVAVNLAAGLAKEGFKVGLLDIDIHGPSIPKLLNIENHKFSFKDETIQPINVSENLKAVSIGFLLEDNQTAVIWRGPRKMGIIKQFIKDVEWNDLDYLIVDSPPGTGDEPLTICQLIPDADGAIIVTTPQDLAIVDVQKAITFCRQLNMKILGVIENMSGFTCPNCGKVFNILKSGGGIDMANEMDVPFLGRIPIDPDIVISGDEGKPFTGLATTTPSAQAFKTIIDSILNFAKQNALHNLSIINKGENPMKIAIPLANGKLSMHFGHCEEFALIEIDENTKTIKGKAILTAPPHEPGLLPTWLADNGVNVIVAGGMGSRAQGLFAEQKIKVVVGVTGGTPEEIVTAYLQGSLVTGANACDH